jgi:hypothetical protein
MLVIACSVLVLQGCAALGQRRDQVVTREPGHRTLGYPVPVYREAAEDLDFALLSDAAYGRTPAGVDAKSSAPLLRPGVVPCADPDAALLERGWEPWLGLPNATITTEIERLHLRVEVWVNRPRKLVAVTFGGTVLGNRNDLLANVRWFLPRAFLAGHPDEYSAVVQLFAPHFAQEYRRRLESSEADWAFLKTARLYSTGHSLGGGLAQQFAYSLPLDAAHKVDKVYAFDPSPVTGFYSVDEAVREHNRRGLYIDRIYERGEVLALVRSLTSFVKQPTARDASIRGVRYSLFYPATPVGGHSISHLACELSKVVANAPPAVASTGAGAP